MGKPHLALAVVVGPVCFLAGALLGEEPDGPRLGADSSEASVAPSADGLGATFSVTAPTPTTTAAGVEAEAQAPADGVAPVAATAPSSHASVPASTAPPPALGSPTDPTDIASGSTPDLYMRLAMACGSDFPDQARSFLLAGLRAAPLSTPLLAQLATLDPGAFRAAVDVALSQASDPRPFLEMLGRIDPAAALNKMRALLGGKPGDARLLALIVGLDEAGGLDDLRRALAADPANWDLIATLAQYSPAEAFPMFEANFRADPDSGAVYSIVDAALDLEDPSRALPYVEQALAAATSPEELLDLIQLLAQIDPVAAIARYDDLEHQPTDPGPLTNLVFAYSKAGRNDEALALAQQVVQLELARDGGTSILSTLLSEYDPSAGLALAWDLIARNPDQFDMKLELLWAYSEAGRTGELRSSIQGWIEATTRATDASALASTLEEFEDFQAETLAGYRKAYELDPSDVDPLQRLVETHPATALQLVSPRLLAEPSRGDLRYVLRQGLYVLGERAPAQVLPWFDRFPADPSHGDPDYLDELAYTCEQGASAAGRRAARTLYQRAERLVPDEERRQTIARLR